MKELVDKYIAAKSEIEKHVSQVFDEYAKRCMVGDETMDYFDICEGEVEIKWYVTWAYGGDDGGYIRIPIEDFCGDWKSWVRRQPRKDQQ